MLNDAFSHKCALFQRHARTVCFNYSSKSSLTSIRKCVACKDLLGRCPLSFSSITLFWLIVMGPIPFCCLYTKVVYKNLLHGAACRRDQSSVRVQNTALLSGLQSAVCIVVSLEPETKLRWSAQYCGGLWLGERSRASLVLQQAPERKANCAARAAVAQWGWCQRLVLCKRFAFCWKSPFWTGLWRSQMILIGASVWNGCDVKCGSVQVDNDIRRCKGVAILL